MEIDIETLVAVGTMLVGAIATGLLGLKRLVAEVRSVAPRSAQSAFAAMAQEMGDAPAFKSGSPPREASSAGEQILQSFAATVEGRMRSTIAPLERQMAAQGRRIEDLVIASNRAHLRIDGIVDSEILDDRTGPIDMGIRDDPAA